MATERVRTEAGNEFHISLRRRYEAKLDEGETASCSINTGAIAEPASKASITECAATDG